MKSRHAFQRSSTAETRRANYVNTSFAQVEYDFHQPKEVPNWIIGANVLRQGSVGDDLLTGRPFQTYQASGKVLMTYKGWNLLVVGSVTGNQSGIFSPFGAKPNYTDMQQCRSTTLVRRRPAAACGTISGMTSASMAFPDSVSAYGISRAGAPSIPRPVRESTTGTN